MVRSMTGFGRSEQKIDGRDITVEIKSVNHRYFEFSCRSPKGYGFIDEKLKSFVNSRVSRGKVEVFVTIGAGEDTSTEVTVNHQLVAGYISAMKDISEVYGIENDISVMSLSRFPDVFTIHKAPEDEEKIIADVLEAAAPALDTFIAMREAEGERMRADILARAEKILDIVSEIEKRSPETVREYENRLRERICRTLESFSVELDEQRILTEVALFSDKIDVAEETVRLRSHFVQLRGFLDGDQPTGRKIDFIIQEMNREANTIGSKVTDAELAHKVVEIKGELEKIREQIQNIE